MKTNRADVQKVVVALVAIIVLLVPAGCSGSNGSVSSGGTLVICGSEPGTLDPANCADATAGSYIVEIFSGLVTLDSNLSVVPDIAQSWNISSNGTVYTFHLRNGVRFQDGREVNASDFKYSIERAADPATGSQVAEAYLGDIVGFTDKLSGKADNVSGVRVVDERTLEITIDAPKAYFLSKLTHPVAFVVDRYNVESGADWWRKPNGTGPFKLKQWNSGLSIILERNDNYYRGAAKLQQVSILLQGDSMQLYENGGIGITAVGADEIDKVLDPTSSLNKELVSAPELSLEYIVFNTNAAPFDDPKVRQALCYAVDKEKIVDILTKDTVSVAEGILPPGIPGYDKDFAGLEFNVSKARELINESSYRDGLPPIVLSVSGSCAGLPAVDEAIAYMWEENLGINVTLEAIDFSTLLDDARSGKLQTFELGWIADYPDAENFLDLLFHCGAVENHAGYCNQSVDALLEQAGVASDTESRLELYRQAETAIVDDAPCLPLWFGQNYYLVKPYVKGFEPAPMIIPWMKDVWIAE